MGSVKADGNSVPIYTSGIGARINELARLAGSKKKLANMAGLSESQLHRIASGDSQAKIENIAAIAINCGVSIDWLAIGKISQDSQGVCEQPLVYHTDAVMLQDVLTAVEKYLDEHDLVLEPGKKAELITLLYDYFQAKGRVENSETERFLRLITK